MQPCVFEMKWEMDSFHLPLWWRVIKWGKKSNNTAIKLLTIKSMEWKQVHKRWEGGYQGLGAPAESITAIARRQTEVGGGGSTGETSVVSEFETWDGSFKNGKWAVVIKTWKSKKLAAIEDAITGHKLKRLVDIKPRKDCTTSSIKLYLIIQDEYLLSVKKPEILSLLFSSSSLFSLCSSKLL